MSATSDDWNQWLSRKSAAPAEWVQNLLQELDPYLQGAASQKDRDWVAAYLLRDKCMGLGCSDDKGLKDWEADVGDDLRPNDFLHCRPSVELPVLIREFAQALDLPGIDAVGARPNEDAQRIGWQKQLTKQACEVYRWERENHIESPKDWVPRKQLAEFDCWPEADSVQLPIFFVARDREGREQGFNGWLRIWLWPCEGAQLEWLPSVPQRVQPLCSSWVRGLQQASEWVRRQLQGQGGNWKDHALVWDVHTSDQNPYDVLLGASASAAFALAGLWLARHSAPVRWAGFLSSLSRKDWRSVRITAAIRGGEVGDGETEGDLMPVGGAGVKDLANWVLKQADARRQAPLRVAKGQPFELEAPGQPLPEFIEYTSAHDLLQALARDALDLGDSPLGPLLGALQPTLHHFAPEEAPPMQGSPATPCHLPQLEPAWQAPMADSAWQALVSKAAVDRGARDSLEAFALQRWATLAREQHEGGSVNCLFVNLSVQDQKRSGGPYSLHQLLAEYEPDSESPAQAVQGLMIVGAPGGGKTWLLQRFEQACVERLLWQLDQQERQSEQVRPATATQTFLDVPLYVTLSGLPTEHKSEKNILRWFCTQVLGSADAPDSPLKRRLLNPESEPGLRLRIILDGLNEAKVGPRTDRATRIKDVVRALWGALKPGLPMLLGTRTHHQYPLDHTGATGHPFKVAVANLNAWGPADIKGYLLKRWVGDTHAALRSTVGELIKPIERDDAKGRRLREVLGLPLYLRIQCELLEAGATRLLDSRAQLMAALLWRNLHKEFIEKIDKGKDRSDLDLFTKQERKIAKDFHDNPDQDPPAFPRKGRLLQGLFALAWAMWLANPNEPVESRGKVALPLGEPEAPGLKGSERANDQRPVSVQGVLSQLGWPKQSLQRCMDQWITVAQELGWLTVDEGSRTARFAHQAYGEFLASQQLFWKPRHAAKNGTPQPLDWTADELAELASLLAPPALAMSCIEELETPNWLGRLWSEVPSNLLERWASEGIAVPSVRVRTEMSTLLGESTVEVSLLSFIREGLIVERGEEFIWNLQLYGNSLRARGVFTLCDPLRPWQQQPLAWALMSRHKGVWRPFRQAIHQELEDRLGPFVADALFSEIGFLPEAPAGDLDEVALLALESLSDPFRWMQALLNMARQTTIVASRQALQTRQTGCWALLSRAWLQERQRLQRNYSAKAELVALQRDLSCLLLAVNQSEDPELTAASVSSELVWKSLDRAPVGPHDLRYRLQAGHFLSIQGPLGSDAGDHVRYERKVMESDVTVSGVRLRREHWCEVTPADSDVARFLVARYPVTVGEFRAFVEAGGYRDPGAAWWLQGLTWENSGASAWLREAMSAPRSFRSRSIEEGPFYGKTSIRHLNLYPMVNVNLYEAAAYAHWASEFMYSDWIDELRRAWDVADVALRLPTSSEWLELCALTGQDRSRGICADRYFPLMSNIRSTGLSQTSAVGSFPASQHSSGLFDLWGNVRAWSCSVEDQEQLFGTSVENDGLGRDVCGRSFLTEQADTYWDTRLPDDDGFDIGFRLVLAVAL